MVHGDISISSILLQHNIAPLSSALEQTDLLHFVFWATGIPAISVKQRLAFFLNQAFSWSLGKFTFNNLMFFPELDLNHGDLISLSPTLSRCQWRDGGGEGLG
jgi:hypothetical protein